MIEHPSQATYEKACAILRTDGLVAFPTETVYGLGANALSDHAVAHLYATKNRPTFNPLIVHVRSLEEAERYGSFNGTAHLLASAFWPGPLTLVVPLLEKSPFSKLVLAGLTTVAIRVPRHPIALHLLQAFGYPVVAPSANRSGHLSPTQAHHVAQSLGSSVPLIVDGGPTICGIESTIIDVTTITPTILRPGALDISRMETCLGYSLTTDTFSSSITAPLITAPGQMESHYAPHLPLRMNVTIPQPTEAFLGFGPTPLSHKNLSPQGDFEEAAANLFSFLYDMDQPDRYRGIAVAPIPMDGLGTAINDRLKRASAPRPQ